MLQANDFASLPFYLYNFFTLIADGSLFTFRQLHMCAALDKLPSNIKYHVGEMINDKSQTKKDVHTVTKSIYGMYLWQESLTHQNYLQMNDKILKYT